jgi:hypothetical protein
VITDGEKHLTLAAAAASERVMRWKGNNGEKKERKKENVER